MIAALRSEFFKLRTVRVHGWLSAAGVIALAVAAGLYAGLAPDPETLTRQDLLHHIGTFSVMVSIATGIVAAFAVTSEFRFGTLRQTLIATPQRLRIFASKAIVSGFYGVGIGAIAAVAAVGVGTVLLDARGGGTGLSTADGTLFTFVGVVILAALFALFGCGIGMLVRNVPIAVAIVVLWPLAIERAIGAVLVAAGVDPEDRFLPYTAATSLVTPELDADAVGRLYGGLFLGLVALVLVGLGVAVNSRRDV